MVNLSQSLVSSGTWDHGGVLLWEFPQHADGNLEAPLPGSGVGRMSLGRKQVASCLLRSLQYRGRPRCRRAVCVLKRVASERAARRISFHSQLLSLGSVWPRGLEL